MVLKKGISLVKHENHVNMKYTKKLYYHLLNEYFSIFEMFRKKMSFDGMINENVRAIVIVENTFCMSQSEKDKMSNGQHHQRSAYMEAHAVAHAAVQQHMAQQAAQARLLSAPVPSAPPQAPNPTFTLPDDGLGYDDGVRVLRSIGTWWADCGFNFRR